MLSEPMDKPYEPLDFDRFKDVQNNFYLAFIDEPLNGRRYEIPDICDALNRFDRGEELNFDVNQAIKILRKINPDLERRLTEAITKGKEERRRYEAIGENMELLYEAYLILRDFVDGNEGEEFDFGIFYPPK